MYCSHTRSIALLCTHPWSARTRNNTDCLLKAVYFRVIRCLRDNLLRSTRSYLILSSSMASVEEIYSMRRYFWKI